MRELQIDNPRALEAWSGLRPSESLDLEASPLSDEQVDGILGDTAPHLRRALEAAARSRPSFPRTPLMAQ
eukprot:12229542-Alexandrium_andersonii.AAC.1